MGAHCIGSCPFDTFNNNGVCTGKKLVFDIHQSHNKKIACTTLDASCVSCNSTVTCQACSGGLLALGGRCVGSCPDGTYSDGVQCICTENKFFFEKLISSNSL